MTLFDDDRYAWRETYFVCFESSHRPKLPDARRALQTHAPLLEVLDAQADEHENLVMLTLASYEDHAAVEVVYREGNDILDEAKHLFHTLRGDATAKELLRLQKIVHWRTRFDVHHFEQTAATGVFNVTKLPEIKFPERSTTAVDHSDVFTKALAPDKRQFYFDSNSYERCRHGRSGEISETAGMDSEIERINPEMLVRVLEILCDISQGIALDPASGIVLE